MDDLISRSDAIGAVKEERFPIDSDYAEGFMAALDKVEWILKEWLPSAQPERESIKWIPHESIFGGPDERVYTCDKCGYNIGFHVENFCPNCGGKYERYEKKEGER